jgi:hypothetical protein
MIDFEKYYFNMSGNRMIRMTVLMAMGGNDKLVDSFSMDELYSAFYLYTKNNSA